MKIAVIGAGHMGRYHAEKFARLPSVEVTVVDPDPARAKIADFRTILDQLDAAVVAVPTDRHHEVAIACLEKGLHLLIEKPIAATVEQADALIALASKHGVVLQVGHVERYNPTFKALTARMDRPMFIEAERLAAFKQRGVEVDVVLDLMIHDLDLAVALARAEVASVSAGGFRVLTNDIDIANARIEFENGCVANLAASRVSQAAVRKLRVFQHGVYVSADLQGGKLRYVSQSGGQIEQKDESYAGGDALAEQASSFVSAIENRLPVQVSGSDGRRALKLALDVGRLIRERLRKFA